MLRPLSLLALAVTAVLAGCGGDDDPPSRDLRSPALTIVDWGAAAPRALCETEEEARAAAGREAVQTDERCWVAIKPSPALATGADVTGVTAVDSGGEQLRFTAAARRRLLALGTDSHVGVLYDGRLLGVVFPAEGQVRIPPVRG